MSDYKIHPSAEVQTDDIGSETSIWQHTVILKNAKIGKNCNINAHCFIENDVQIGDNVTIKCGVYLWDGIILEDDVFVGPNVTFTNDKTPRSKQYPESFFRTTVRRGASLGAASVITPGIVIGAYSMVGAGSVVTKNIPSHTLWFGNPAKMAGFICSCGQRLSDKYQCAVCGKNFLLRNEELEEI